MKITRTVEIEANITPDEMAHALADSDADTQAEFFHVFVEEIHRLCRTLQDVDVQLWAINNKLSEFDKEVLSNIIN